MQSQKWNFDNSYAKLPNIFFTEQNPVPIPAPKLIIFNHPLAKSLNVPYELQTLAGNATPPNTQPIAQAYAGHQFGHFTKLGDGRAILIGEHVTPTGKRVDIQLKGSGKTPYSRGGDGRAALGPMLREYIISEAMFSLGVPTTRSLAVVATGEIVQRERKLQGAILTRVANSHIRVGTFEYAANYGTVNDVRALANYTMARHFPKAETYVEFLKEVIKRQALLIAKWQLIGFIHGVMNTDNMAISGETIDYGPCAFMDTYNPDTVFSSIDEYGRYAYKNQPKMAAWNLARFAETLLPLLHDNKNKATELAQTEVTNFTNLYKNNWLAGMRAKLGLTQESQDDERLIKDLLQIMQRTNADYTNTFRNLTLGRTDTSLHQWNERLQAKRPAKPTHNPTIIPRNHQIEKALSAAEQGDLTVAENLLRVLEKPYDYSSEHTEYSTPPARSCAYKTFCGT